MPALDSPRAAPGRWSDLRKRSLSAAILAPVALLCIWFGNAGWGLLMAIAALGLGLEWAALCGLHARLWPGALPAAAITAATVAALLGHPAAALLAIPVAALLVWQLTRRPGLAAGIPYLAIPLVALVWLRGNDATGRADLLFLVAIVWASDIGAYAVGRLVGGPRLAPTISPGKTWSGAVGGLLIAMAVGEAVAQALLPAPPGRAAAIAALLAATSAAGDLLESGIKRRFGVKDSGRLIPGHGGLLDRLDGLLAAAPAAALLALALGRTTVLWH